MTSDHLTLEERDRARTSPVDYACVISRGWYRRAPHLDFLNVILTCLAARKAPAWLLRRLDVAVPKDVDDDEELPFHRLIIEMPPRHAKSETCSHYFASWYLGMNPDHHVMVTSYGQEKADEFGRAARDDISEFGEDVFGIKIRDDSSAAHRWQIEGHRGGMYAAGVGGAITGRGADCLIIDDPLKNAQEAWSVTTQDSLANWYDSTADTRLTPDAIVLVIMTRWHAKDLVGYLLDGESRQDEDKPVVRDAWARLSLPAVAGEDDQLGRKPGEPLWPVIIERDGTIRPHFDSSWAERKEARMRRTEIGKYYWLAMFQQKPGMPEGLLFFDKKACEYGRDHAPDPVDRIPTSPFTGAEADGYILVWERPRTGERYYIGADTAGGKGEVLGTLGNTGGPDRNHATIHRVSDDMQVCAIHGRQEESNFAQILNEIGRRYHNALLGVENNRRAVVNALKVLQYPNLYMAPTAAGALRVMPKTNPERFIEYGWNTNTLSRPPMLSDLQEEISSRAQLIRDREAWEELLTFVQGDPPKAMPGTHDDRVMAHAIRRQVGKQAKRNNGGADGGLKFIQTGFG